MSPGLALLAAAFSLGYALGRRAAIRRSAQLLRDTFHLDAAKLIDRRKGRM